MWWCRMFRVLWEYLVPTIFHCTDLFIVCSKKKEFEDRWGHNLFEPTPDPFVSPRKRRAWEMLWCASGWLQALLQHLQSKPGCCVVSSLSTNSAFVSWRSRSTASPGPDLFSAYQTAFVCSGCLGSSVAAGGFKRCCSTFKASSTSKASPRRSFVLRLSNNVDVQALLQQIQRQPSDLFSVYQTTFVCSGCFCWRRQALLQEVQWQSNMHWDGRTPWDEVHQATEQPSAEISVWGTLQNYAMLYWQYLFTFIFPRERGRDLNLYMHI